MTLGIISEELHDIPSAEQVREMLDELMPLGLSARDAHALYVDWVRNHRLNGQRILREMELMP